MSVSLFCSLYSFRLVSIPPSSCSMTTSRSLMKSVVFLAERFLSCTHSSLYTSIRVLRIFSARDGYVSSRESTTTEVCFPDTVALSLAA